MGKNWLVLLFLANLQVSANAGGLTTEDLIQQLAPVAKTRSLAPNRGIEVTGGEQQELRPSVNLYINFDYNSDKLKQDALITLDRLAAALQDERLAKFDFLIGGHTDAAGPAPYNQSLSERRAGAVRFYLTHRHSIDGTRLIAKGFGENRLLDPNAPLDGVNRRVQVINISVPEE